MVAASNTTVSLDYTTISGNTANYDSTDGGEGGGFAHYAGTFYLQSSIVYDNHVNLGSDPDCFGSLTTLGYNLLGVNSTGCIYSADVTDIVGSNPLLENIEYNGGPTRTHALQPSSTAINHIPSGVAGCGTTYPTDQRGVLRLQDCDIGAYS